MYGNLCDSLESHNHVWGYATLAANDASKMEITEKYFFLNRILHEHLSFISHFCRPIFWHRQSGRDRSTARAVYAWLLSQATILPL